MCPPYISIRCNLYISYAWSDRIYGVTRTKSGHMVYIRMCRIYTQSYLYGWACLTHKANVPPCMNIAWFYFISPSELARTFVRLLLFQWLSVGIPGRYRASFCAKSRIRANGYGLGPAFRQGKSFIVLFIEAVATTDSWGGFTLRRADLPLLTHTCGAQCRRKLTIIGYDACGQCVWSCMRLQYVVDSD